MSDFPPAVPQLLHTVLDAVDVRAEAEFWRDLLGLAYRSGDEVPDHGPDDASRGALPGHPSRPPGTRAVEGGPSAADVGDPDHRRGPGPHPEPPGAAEAARVDLPAPVAHDDGRMGGQDRADGLDH